MGCDIHIAIQKQLADGTWEEIPYQVAPWNKDDRPLEIGIPVAPRRFGARDYDLFGILANVRNGSGFAGCLTGSGWPSIADDRGFPAGFDVDALLPDPKMAKYDERGPRWLGDHSFTWVSLDELKAFPWDTTLATIYGCVTGDVFDELKPRNLKPANYSGGISGPGIQVYSEDEWLNHRAECRAARPYVRMSWTESAREATYDWAGEVIPWLESLADGRPLRLVMGFDS